MTDKTPSTERLNAALYRVEAGMRTLSDDTAIVCAAYRRLERPCPECGLTLAQCYDARREDGAIQCCPDCNHPAKGRFAGVVIGGQLVCPECGVRPSEGHVTGCPVPAEWERDKETADLARSVLQEQGNEMLAIRKQLKESERKRVSAEEALYKFMFEGDMHIVVDHASLRAWVETVKP